jgi:hypothetical protein
MLRRDFIKSLLATVSAVLIPVTVAARESNILTRNDRGIYRDVSLLYISSRLR